MYKVICWQELFFFLGEHTVIEVQRDAVSIENTMGVQFIRYKTSSKVMERIEKDKLFDAAFHSLVRHLIISFLQDPRLHVIDLEGSILISEIEDVKAKILEALPVTGDAKNAN